MQGLASICHETRKGGHNGRRWPKHRRAFSLLDEVLAALWRRFSRHTTNRRIDRNHLQRSHLCHATRSSQP